MTKTKMTKYLRTVKKLSVNALSQSYFRVIAMSPSYCRYRTIAIVSSHCRHRTIAPSRYRTIAFDPAIMFIMYNNDGPNGIPYIMLLVCCLKKLPGHVPE